MNVVSAFSAPEVMITGSEPPVVVLHPDDVEIISVSAQGPPGPQGVPGPPSTIPGPVGPPGLPGNTVLYGTTDPTGSMGLTGNFYINTTTHFIFGPKSDTGIWPAGTSLVGPQGATGAQGPAGTATVLVSDTPPGGAADSTLWYESDSGLLYFRFNDGTSTQWVIACPQPDLTSFILEAAKDGKTYGRKDGAWNAVLPAGGGTMTGDLILNKSAPSVTLNKAASGEAAVLYGQKGNLMRWQVVLGGAAAEGGGNSGSDFSVGRFNDAGSFVDSPLVITRTTGVVSFSSGIISNSNVDVAGQVNSANGYVVTGQNANLYSNSAGTYLNTNSSNCYFGYIKSSGDWQFVVNGALTAYFPYTGSGSHIIITANAFKPGGGAWIDSSDERIKNVESEYTIGLDAVTQLRPVVYTFKGNDTTDPPKSIQDPIKVPVIPYENSTHYGAALNQTKYLGLVAQEVESVFPQIVTQRSGYINGVAADDIRDLDTSPLIFALINAVKELKARIEVLENV